MTQKRVDCSDVCGPEQPPWWVFAFFLLGICGVLLEVFGGCA